MAFKAGINRGVSMHLKSLTYIGIVGAVVLFLTDSQHKAFAQMGDVSKCDATLIKDTFSRRTNDVWTVYAATLVTSDQYVQQNKTASGNAVIYGIPMGANYSDYHARAEAQYSKYNYESTYSNQTDVLRSVLSMNATAAYTACLAEQFHGLAAWASDIGSNTVTVSLNFRTAKDDKTARKFIMHADGAGISEIDEDFFKDKKIGEISNYPIVLQHHPNEEVVFQVINLSTNEKAVVRVPLQPVISYSEWDNPTDTPHQSAHLVPTRVGEGIDNHFCVTPDVPGAELIPETFVVTHLKLTGAKARTLPEPDPVPSFAPTVRRICYYASAHAFDGVFTTMDFDFWAQQHKKITRYVPQNADWAPKLISPPKTP